MTTRSVSAGESTGPPAGRSTGARAWPPVQEPPLAAPIVDTHCHLDMVIEQGGPDVAESLAVAAAVGVTRIIQAGCDVAGSRWAVEQAIAHPHVWAAVALHPNEAPRIHSRDGLPGVEAAWSQIEALAAQPQVRAVGETGMDFFRTEPAGRAIQEESFRRHIDIAKRVGKPLVVHDREAHADVLRIIDDEGAPPVVVLHCFSGDTAFAREATDRGWYCSFAGVLTFKNAQQLRDAAAAVSADRLLVETDAPFLAPTPYRGKTNGSHLLPLTVRAMCEVRKSSELELCEQLWRNSADAFGAL